MQEPETTAPEITPAQRIAAFADAHGVTMRAEFVPFSRSHHADGKGPGDGGKPWLSLNWKVTLAKAGRDFVTVDYSSGSGNAPASKAGKLALIHSGMPEASARAELIAWECEHGKPGRWFGYGSTIMGDSKRPILPDIADILSSLSSNASVLDCGTFEEWAADLGYDSDSRLPDSLGFAGIGVH